MPYQPGTHIIASLQVSGESPIHQSSSFQQFINQEIESFQLVKLGEVYHDFKPAGFTAVVCLSESHLSIHTWPEHQLVNLDIYLSNFQRTNDQTVHSLYSGICRFFNGSIMKENIIIR